MEQWTAQSAISSSVVYVTADMRPKDMREKAISPWTEAYAVFSDPADPSFSNQFLGVVPRHVVGQYPYRIFSDLLPLSKSIQIDPTASLDFLSSTFQQQCVDAFSVIDIEQQFIGAVTPASLWKTLYQRERHVSEQLQKELKERLHLEQQLQKVYASLTEHKDHQNELQELFRNELCAASIKMIAAEKHQRQELAIDLHDHLAQMLAVGRMKVAQTNNLIKDPEVQKLMGSVDQLLQESLHYTRSLMAELNPFHLSQAGLQANLEALVEKLSHYGLEIILDFTEPIPNLPENEIFNLYWSIRELLFNVLKHSGVKQAHLLFRRVKGHDLQFTIRDNGNGFPQKITDTKDRSGSHLGLYLVRERMRVINGTMFVYTNSRGTDVQLNLPIPHQNRSTESPGFGKDGL